MNVTREEFGEIYKRGFTTTVRFLMSKGVPYDLAEETAQDAWLRAWERLPQLRQSSMAVAWVNSIARNLHLQHLRGKPVSLELNSHLPAPASIDISAIVVQQALRLCRQSDRILLRQFYIEGVNVGDIARYQGLSHAGVRIRLLRARRSLRKLIDS